jgi:two-component system LytT family sensor kinase
MVFFNSKYPDINIKMLLGHIGCWLLFIIYELNVLYNINGQVEPVYIYIIYYAINISFFYAHISLLSFVFYRPKRTYLLGVAGYVSLIALYFCVKSLADFLLDAYQPPIQNPLIYVRGFIARNLTRVFFFTMMATFYWFAGYVSFAEKRKATAERMRLLAEKDKADVSVMLEKSRNAYLQQQINPHMLFNTLNFVYNSVQKHSEDAAQCVWLLAEIMRFSMEETGPDGKIEIAREAEQMENLLAINRYRYHERLAVTFAIAEQFDGLRIIPLILLTLTENVFKHGDLTDENKPAVLRLTTEAGGRVQFFSRNLKKSKNDSQRRPSLGLQNVRIRLDKAYPGNYQLLIEEAGDYFEITLTLNLCA